MLFCGPWWCAACGTRSDHAADGEVDARDEIGKGGDGIALEYAHVLRWQESLAVSLSYLPRFSGWVRSMLFPTVEYAVFFLAVLAIAWPLAK